MGAPSARVKKCGTLVPSRWSHSKKPSTGTKRRWRRWYASRNIDRVATVSARALNVRCTVPSVDHHGTSPHR